ncbi:MAG: hypothetical protein P4L53_10065 [Candidatus Obscuribacterales bacterium]|nr:hypothetical protein [Candidatus Obscuribacterales bacterium]
MSDIDKLPAKDSQSEVKSDTHSIGSQVSALWKDAYEHPRAAAAVAAGAAVVGVGLAAEHTPLGRMLGLAKDVLVIEDTSLFSHCITRSLTSQGEKVTILNGIESLKPFVGILEDGSTKAFNLHKVKAAFVDGDLLGKLHGPDVVPVLHDKRVFTVAMSSDPEINDLMVWHGANLGAQKPVIMQALKEDQLRVPQAMKNPFETQAALDEKRVHFNDPIEVSHRKKMERDMMTEFLHEEEAAEKAKAAAKEAAKPAAKTAMADSTL